MGINSSFQPIATIVPTTLLLLLVLGCKPLPTDSAQLSTLDNLTRADDAAVKQNICGPLQAAPTIAAKLLKVSDSKLNNDVHGAVAAMPANLRTLFFSGNRPATIEVSTSALNLCKNAFATASEKSFAAENDEDPKACWRKTSGRGVNIIAAPDQQVIRHGLLRLSAFVYDEVFVQSLRDMASSSSAGAPMQSLIAEYDRKKRDLSRAFLQDLAKKTENQRLQKLRRMNQEQPVFFDRMLVAEAIDSYYCNQETHATFRREFPSTYAAFKGGSVSQIGPGSLAADFGATYWGQ